MPGEPTNPSRHAELLALADRYRGKFPDTSLIRTLARKLTAETARHDAIHDAYAKDRDEVEQILGMALGYPWFKDDPKNFPDATEANGVCIGEHITATLAEEAARRVAKGDALRAGVEGLALESIFNQQRFAEDTDTDYFLRCFKSVKDRIRALLEAGG